MKRNFNEWFGGFRKSIATYKYYTNFERVYNNAQKYKVELNILNSLIGSKNIEKDFITLFQQYPNIIQAIPILIAKRESEIYCIDENGAVDYKFDFDRRWDSVNVCKSGTDYAYFMKETGLFDLLENHIINNLVDYVMGVEVGLDSNARKSRGGDLMENLVESYLEKAGLIKGENYFKEMSTSGIESKWGINLAAISNNGKTEKRFDFVVKTDEVIYAIETNFYSTQGSKLNETARSYKNIAIDSKEIKGFVFVWLTDGQGWISARHNLEETFDVMDNIYNIKDLEEGIITKLLSLK